MFETRFTSILAMLKKTMGNHVVRMDIYAPLSVLIWARLTRMCQRLERLVTQWRAGTLPKPRPSRAGQPRPAAAAAARPSGLPRNFAWLLRLTGITAAAAASQLRFLMTDDAEMRAFLADCPRGGRILRPLCHMLGMRLSEVELAPIRLPPRPRKPRAPKPRAPRQGPDRGFTRAQIDRMTAAELTAHYGRLPPHFPLPIRNLGYIRRKIAAG
jgi:hypothetical protein